MTKSKDRPTNSLIAVLAEKQRIRDAEAAEAAASDSDVEAFGPNANDAYSLVSAIADASLAAALPARLRARLKDGRPVALVVAVPDVSWVDPIEAAATRAGRAVHVIARNGKLRSQHRPEEGGYQVAHFLADGRPVVGVAPSPELGFFRRRWWPPPTPGSRSRRRPGGCCAGCCVGSRAGPVPRDLGSGCTSLTFDEIVAAFRGGASAREVLASFARTVANKAGRGAAADDVPALPDLPGFSGEAREWGVALIEGFNSWKQGKVKWLDLDASAVLAGPPAAGKTFFVRSLAKTLGVPLHATNVGSWFAGRSDGALGGVILGLLLGMGDRDG